eukprot:scaffold308212_cov10-Tisochrysis_lutea.AAC.1
MGYPLQKANTCLQADICPEKNLAHPNSYDFQAPRLVVYARPSTGCIQSKGSLRWPAAIQVGITEVGSAP